MRNVFLLDTSWVYYRSKYSLKLTYDVAGVTYNTGTIVGLHNMILDIFNYDSNATILLCADGVPKLHQTLNSNYKGSREVADKSIMQLSRFELTKQFTIIPNCYFVYHKDLEADESIGLICKLKKSDASERYIIVSKDGDLRQLIDSQKNICCSTGFEAKRPKIEDEVTMQTESVKGLEGLSPDEIPMYLAIVGDTSDDIVGISRFSKKHAKTIVKEFKYPYLLREYINSGEYQNSDLKKYYEKIKENFKAVELNFRLTYIDPIYIPTITKDFKGMDLSYFEKYGCFNIMGDIQQLINIQTQKAS